MVKRIFYILFFLIVLVWFLPLVTSLDKASEQFSSISTSAIKYVSYLVQPFKELPAYASQEGGPFPLTPPPPPIPPIPPCGSCDCGGCCDPNCGNCGANGSGGVNLTTGYESLNATDLIVKGQIPIKLNRWYQSGSSYDSPLGYGWSFAYNVRFYLTADNTAIIREGCGAEYFFVFTGGTWQAPANYNVQLYNNSGIYTMQERDGSQLVFDPYGRLSTSTDASGNSLKFQYDSNVLFPIYGVSPYGLGSTPTITSYDYRLTEIDQYNASGNPTGRWVKYSYDDSTGRMTGITDSHGRSIAFAHDQYGNLTGVSVYDANSNVVGDPNVYNYSTPTNHLVTSYSGGESPVDKGFYADTYDSQRRVVEQTHGIGSGQGILQFQYAMPTFTASTSPACGWNPAGWQCTLQKFYPGFFNTVYESTSNGFSVSTVFIFNSDGMLLQKIDGLGHITNYTRDLGGVLADKVRFEEDIPNGLSGPTLIKTYQYDTFGNLLTETATDVANNITITTNNVYDQTTINQTLVSNPRIISTTISSNIDPNTIFRADYDYNHNASGYPTTLADMKQYINSTTYLTATSYTYDSNGQLTLIVRPGNDPHNYTYTNGLLTSADGISYAYDQYDNISSITDRNGNVTQYTYDAIGRLTKVIDPNNVEIDYTYTGRDLTQIQKGSEITNYQYDTAQLHRVTQITKMNGSTPVTSATYSYDLEGNVISIKDGDNNTTNFGYDALNRFTGVTEAGKTTSTTYTYDMFNNKTRMTDANGHTTSYTYDAFSRLVSVTNPAGTTHYSYDAMNNLLSVTDANSHTTSYTYDLLSRLVEETKPGGQTTQYSYDADSRLSQRIDAKGQHTVYSYNNDDNLTGIAYSDHSVSFGVDSNGNVLTVNDPSVYNTGNLYENRYDKLNRLIWQRNNFENTVIGYQFDSFGIKVGMGVTAGTATYNWMYQYNGLNQLTSMTDSCGNTTRYDYKNSGRLKDKYLPNGITGAYAYNPNGDVNTIGYTISGSTNVLNLNYPSYDNAHNILTQVKNGVTKTFSYDNVNQLVGVNVSGTNTESFTYDYVGNRLSSIDNSPWSYNTDNELTGYGATTLTYDANGNMIVLYDGSVSHNLTYDFENRLASYDTASDLYDPQGRRLSKTVNSVVTRYLWDGATMIAELDGTNQIQRLYTYNPQTMEPVSTAIGCTAYFYITDHLMTPQMMTDITGTTVWYAELSAFGTANVITSTVTNNLRFPGQYADAESGMYYNMNRYYVPSIGRYIEPDPILQGFITIPFILERINPEILNPYIYVINNPLLFIDPFGLWYISVGIIGSIGGGVSFGGIDIPLITIGPGSGVQFNPQPAGFLSPLPQVPGGVGTDICWHRGNPPPSQPTPNNQCKKGETPIEPLEEEPPTVSAGAGRYLGVSVSADFNTICINAGTPSWPPINVTWPF